MSLMLAGCCLSVNGCCICSSVNTTYDDSLPSTISCAVAGNIGVNGFSYTGMTLYKTGLCTYETYIGDLTDCDQYPFYMQNNFAAAGLNTYSDYDIYGNCNATACGTSNSNPGGPFRGAGSCVGTEVIAVFVKVSKTYNPCACWQAQVIFKHRLTNRCGDDCTWTTRTDCTDYPYTRSGYTNHIATDKNMLVLKKTNDSIGDLAISNVNAQEIFVGGDATHCPSSSDINNLCGESDAGALTTLYGAACCLNANSPSVLLGNYTLGNITPACTSYATSATSLTRSAIGISDYKNCTTQGDTIPALVVDITNLTIS